MPLGTRHDLRGRLLRVGPWLALAVNGGGTWRLDADRRAERWLGRRVEVSGIREGFDLLAVTAIKGEGEPAPVPAWWRRWLRSAAEAIPTVAPPSRDGPRAEHRAR